jgi:Na+/proline symporter
MQRALPDVDQNLIQNDLAYPAMLTFLPSGLLGLVVASVLAAYISTMSTMLNLGSSYIINDVYVRFLAPDASEKKKVFAARATTIFLMIGTGILALALESATQAFRLLLAVGAGTGLLFFLRWFWMRINAWSEISAMILSLGVAFYLEFFGPDDLEIWQKFALSVGFTTLGWIVITLITPRTNAEKLTSFRHRTKLENGAGLATGIITSLFASVSVYAFMFATGSLLYGQFTAMYIYATISALSFIICWKLYRSAVFS